MSFTPLHLFSPTSRLLCLSIYVTYSHGLPRCLFITRSSRKNKLATLVYQVPGGDFGLYLQGSWKRTLECREFGQSYEHLKTINSVVVVERATDVTAEPGTYVSNAVRKCINSSVLHSHQGSPHPLHINHPLAFNASYDHRAS